MCVSLDHKSKNKKNSFRKNVDLIFLKFINSNSKILKTGIFIMYTKKQNGGLKSHN